MEKLNNNSTLSAERDLDITSDNNVDDMEIYNETNLEEIESFFKNDFEADFLEEYNF